MKGGGRKKKRFYIYKFSVYNERKLVATKYEVFTYDGCHCN